MRGFAEDCHHQATDGLLMLLTKANHDLLLVQHKLHQEFQQTYPDHANPMKLVSRIKKVQQDLSALKDQCHHLLAAKQDLIDTARAVLVGNRNSLQRMQASMGGVSSSDDDAAAAADDSAFDSFNQVIDEWNSQVRSRTTAGNESNKSEPENVNKLLFSAIVQSD